MARHRVLGLLIGLVALAMPAGAGPLTSLMANKPEVENWNTFGKGEAHWQQRNPTVQGGFAMHIDVDAKQQNPWDAQAQALTTRDIQKDDSFLFAFWARGISSKPIPAVVQGIDSAVMGEAAVTVGPAWKLYCIAGISTAGFKAGKFGGVLQIGAAKQSLDLGPAFLLTARAPAERKLIAGGCAGIKSAIAAYPIAPPSIAELKKKLEKILADTHTPGL